MYTGRSQVAERKLAVIGVVNGGFSNTGGQVCALNGLMTFSWAMTAIEAMSLLGDFPPGSAPPPKPASRIRRIRVPPLHPASCQTLDSGDLRLTIPTTTASTVVQSNEVYPPP